MSVFVHQVMQAALPGVIVGLLTALLTVQMSVRRFRREQLLATRYEVYAKLLEMLNNSKLYTEAYEERLFEGQYRQESMSHSELEALRRRWEQDRPEYEKLVLLSSIQLPKIATETLQTYEEEHKRARETGDLVEALDIEHAAAVACMEKLKVIARKDLGGW